MPTGAVSVTGHSPDASAKVGTFDPASLETLIRSRRSVRLFAPGSVDPDAFRRILDVVANAPTGVNARNLRFTAILDIAVMDDFRDRCARLVADNPGRLPEGYEKFIDMAKNWMENGVDDICRGAPHLLVVTAGPEQVCKVPDCLIALSYFDLYAQANGIGTTWCGYIEGLLRIYPESRTWLGIPDDHEIGYAMLFGPAGVHYPRTAQHAARDVQVLAALGGQVGRER